MIRSSLLASAIVLSVPLAAQGSFTNFESSHVHSIRVSDDGTRLYALNAPDGRLNVYTLIAPRQPVLLREIAVGINPTSIAVRDEDELWVVDPIADAVRVVSVSQGTIVATLDVGDEPGDVVIAGGKAYVSATTERQLVVFDLNSRQRVATIDVFGDDPRALAVSADGQSVFAAVFRSGNDTTLVPEPIAPPPPPPTNQNLPAAPSQSIIVDSEDPNWTQLGINLPDFDVAEIDVATDTIRKNHVATGTINFALAERPGTSELWIANTEALNLVRFEPNLRGHSIDSRLTRIDRGQANDPVQPFDLNPTVDYSILPNPGARAIALSQPTAVEFSPNGATLFVAAFNSDKIGIVDPNTGAVTARIDMGSSGARDMKGPRALAHHPTQPLLYVLNSLSNSISTIDTGAQSVATEVGMVYDPTPTITREGRGFLFDARLSGNGTMSCAACHIDATTDNLAWDLGNPEGQMETGFSADGQRFVLHPMKGPMLTQTMQGLAGNGGGHWRSDRQRLHDFNGAFDSLMGGAQIPATDMNDYVRYMQSITYPANPNQKLDRSYSTVPAGLSAEDGRRFYFNNQYAPGIRCNDCHRAPRGSNNTIISAAALRRPQPMKVAQLRNLYKRSGKLQRAQGRTSGFGYAHDGEFDTPFDLFTDPVFSLIFNNATVKTQLNAFMMAFDNGTAPAVGWSATVTAATQGDATFQNELAIVELQASGARCSLIVRGRINGAEVSFLYDQFGRRYTPSVAGGAPKTRADILALLTGSDDVLTFQGVPFSSGARMGLDRNLNGVRDGSEAPVPFGSSSPACASGVQLTTNSPSTTGNEQFSFVVTGATGATSGWMTVGVQKANASLFGVNLLVDMTNAVIYPTLLAGRDEQVAPTPIPANASLSGVTLEAQAILRMPCAPFGFAGSNGLTVTLR